MSRRKINIINKETNLRPKNLHKTHKTTLIFTYNFDKVVCMKTHGKLHMLYIYFIKKPLRLPC